VLQDYERFRMPPMQPRHSKEAMKHHLISQVRLFWFVIWWISLLLYSQRII